MGEGVRELFWGGFGGAHAAGAEGCMRWLDGKARACLRPSPAPPFPSPHAPEDLFAAASSSLVCLHPALAEDGRAPAPLLALTRRPSAQALRSLLLLSEEDLS